MNGYRHVLFSRAELALFAEAQRIVARVPEALGDQTVRCHELARVVARLLGRGLVPLLGKVRVVDGHCDFVDHSWIVLPQGYGLRQAPAHRTLIDIYTVWREPPVQLVFVGAIPGRLGATGYKPGAQRRDIRHSVIKRLVAKLSRKGSR